MVIFGDIQKLKECLTFQQRTAYCVQVFTVPLHLVLKDGAAGGAPARSLRPPGSAQTPRLPRSPPAASPSSSLRSPRRQRSPPAASLAPPRAPAPPHWSDAAPPRPIAALCAKFESLFWFESGDGAGGFPRLRRRRRAARGRGWAGTGHRAPGRAPAGGAGGGGGGRAPGAQAPTL